jgi:hypothetical protein
MAFGDVQQSFGASSSVVVGPIVGRYLQAWDLRIGRQLPSTGIIFLQLQVGAKKQVKALRRRSAPVEVVERRGSGAGR